MIYVWEFFFLFQEDATTSRCRACQGAARLTACAHRRADARVSRVSNLCTATTRQPTAATIGSALDNRTSDRTDEQNLFALSSHVIPSIPTILRTALVPTCRTILISTLNSIRVSGISFLLSYLLFI